MPCGPTTWPSCASRCPTEQGVLAEITSLAADAGHRHLRHRDRPLGRGPARRADPGGRRRRRRHACARPSMPRGLPLPGRAAVVTAPRILVVDGGVRRAAAPSARPARSRSRIASVLLGALAEGTSVIHGCPTAPTWPHRWPRSRRWGPGWSATTTGRSSSTAAGAACTAPAGPLDCGNSGTSMRLLAGLVAGFDWETELVGDDVALGPAHGPGGRAARAHGRHGRRARASAACRRCASGAARCTASTGPPRWPAPR